MSKDDGGPAFPTIAATRAMGPAIEGMSLRDYFAAAIATGMCAAPSNNIADNLSHNAYILADAMLAERTKGE